MLLYVIESVLVLFAVYATMRWMEAEQKELDAYAVIISVRVERMAEWLQRAVAAVDRIEKRLDTETRLW